MAGLRLVPFLVTVLFGAVAAEVVRTGGVERSLSAYQLSPSGGVYAATLLALAACLLVARDGVLRATGAALVVLVAVPAPRAGTGAVAMWVHLSAAFAVFLGMFLTVVARRAYGAAASMVGAGVVAAALCLAGWAYWFVAIEVVLVLAFAASWFTPAAAGGPSRRRRLP